ncbi:EutN/CcmL family microcompartment protein [Mucisphaera sp.]|uniref:EutN/CcmL family microcompartment protein n=1 Tax=Mucisphaera sp. TaxID=2913024 RepID=UPI003D14524B
MKIARVIGTLTLGKRLPELAAGQLLIAEALDAHALAGLSDHAPRSTPMPQSLVVFDALNAGLGATIAVTEGPEASVPFRPNRVPVDAYNAAILDNIEWHPNPTK